MRPRSRRSIRGLLNKVHGDQFENLFLNQVFRLGFNCVRIPNGCKTKSFQGRTKLIRVKSPFDFVVSAPGKSSFIDVKSFSGSGISKSMIKEHQAETLSRLENDGHKSGFIVFFLDHQKVVFFKASQIKGLKKGQSVQLEDGIFLGDFLNFAINHLFE